MDGSLHGVRRDNLATRLVTEQVYGVRGVVPQQVVCPRTRLAQRVHVRAPEEERLHVHLLDVELARRNALAYPLVRRIEPAGMADHAHQARFLLQLRDGLRIRPAVG